jgi:hypothetical protein
MLAPAYALAASPPAEVQRDAVPLQLKARYTRPDSIFTGHVLIASVAGAQVARPVRTSNRPW